MSINFLPPTSPPPCAAMGTKKALHEKEREALFPKWKAALEASNGNVTHAAAAFDPPMTRDRGNRLTRRFKLAEYAAMLREEHSGHARGRQDR